MREYLLYSQIPAAREEQVLGILAGVSGNQPTPIHEQVVLYAQLKAQESVSTKKQPQAKPTVAQPLSYHRLVRGFHVQDDTPIDVQAWTFRAESVPDTGITALIARTVTEHPATDDELARFQQPDLYLLKRHYIQAGNRFVLDNIIVKVTRLFHSPPVVVVEGGEATAQQQQHPTAPLPSPSVPSQLQLVDASGSWLVEIAIRVKDGTNAALNEKAVKELISFKTSVDGSLDLIAPDRLLFDTRVKVATV